MMSINRRKAELWPVLLADTDLDGIRDWTVMDFTGLQDADGKDIYEGDVVDLNDIGCGIERGAIEWDEDLAMFVVVDPDDEPPNGALGDVDMNHIRVIGNIHANPDLLETDDEQ
jgi:hypothetical protein